jgi:flagellar motor protein MotB
MSGFDADEAALMKKPKPVGWFAAGLIGILALGFAAAYYFPLQEAHSTLLAKHEELAKKSAELDHTLKTKVQSLGTTAQRKDELDQFIKKGQEVESKLAGQLQVVQATAERQLTPYVKGKLATVSVAEEELIIAFSERATFSPHTERMIPQVQTQICKVVGAFGQHRDFRVSVEAVISKAEKDSWALASKRAATAAALLTERCQLDVELVVAQGRVVETDSPAQALVIHWGPMQSARLKASEAPAENGATVK